MIRKILHRMLVVAVLSLGALLLYYVFWFVVDAELRGQLEKEWPFRPVEMLFDYAMCCLFTLFSTIYYWRSYEKAERERDKFRLQALENQLSPHFVFNNFSILADLIEVDSKRASAYLMNLSKVYRYTLSHLDHSTVSLREELEFLRQYLALLQQRFGDGIRVSIAPEVSDMQGSLPPAALQMLIENAIKHNEHTLARPLTISVSCTERGIVVCNRKQPIALADEPSRSLSANVGLHNIVERYRFLTRKKVEIINTPEEYRVTIPLIKTEK